MDSVFLAVMLSAATIGIGYAAANSRYRYDVAEEDTEESRRTISSIRIHPLQ